MKYVDRMVKEFKNTFCVEPKEYTVEDPNGTKAPVLAAQRENYYGLNELIIADCNNKVHLEKALLPSIAHTLETGISNNERILVAAEQGVKVTEILVSSHLEKEWCYLGLRLKCLAMLAPPMVSLEQFGSAHDVRMDLATLLAIIEDFS